MFIEHSNASAMNISLLVQCIYNLLGVSTQIVDTLQWHYGYNVQGKIGQLEPLHPQTMQPSLLKIHGRSLRYVFVTLKNCLSHFWFVGTWPDK